MSTDEFTLKCMDRLGRRHFLSLLTTAPLSGAMATSHPEPTTDTEDQEVNRPTPDYDLFAIGGQSNAVGLGDSSQSPSPTEGTAVEYDYENDVRNDPLEDPLQHNHDAARTGSAWPRFAVDYHEITGRNIALVGTARGATSQSKAADTGRGTWDNTGTLSNNLMSAVNRAISHFWDEGDTVVFRGILWSQGERDAREIDNGNATKSDYKTALVEMISRYRGEYGSGMPFWIFETGYWDGKGDTVGFQQVRAAQQEVAHSQLSTFMVSDRQKTFPQTENTDGGLHYDQSGYNIMGAVGAMNVATLTDTTTRALQLLEGTVSQNSYSTGVEGDRGIEDD